MPGMLRMEKMLFTNPWKIRSGYGYKAKVWSLHVWKPRVVGVLGTKRML